MRGSGALNAMAITSPFLRMIPREEPMRDCPREFERVLLAAVASMGMKQTAAAASLARAC